MSHPAALIKSYTTEKETEEREWGLDSAECHTALLVSLQDFWLNTAIG